MSCLYLELRKPGSPQMGGRDPVARDLTTPKDLTTRPSCGRPSWKQRPGATLLALHGSPPQQDHDPRVQIDPGRDARTAGVDPTDRRQRVWEEQLCPGFWPLERNRPREPSELRQASGGPEGLLHFGQKRTEHLILDLGFGQNGYRVQLAPSQDDSLFFEQEVCSFQGHGYPTPYTESLGSSHVESHLATEALRRPDKVASHVLRSMRSWKVYHFHDTGPTARVKQLCDIDDNGFLREDGANLAAFLWRLKESAAPQYAQILSTIRKVTPFFDEFQLREIPRSPEKTRLEWPVHLPCNAAASATTAGNRTPRRARAWPPPVCHPGSGELAAGRVPQNSGDRLNAVGNARKPVRA
jgi:hypothetical protein